MTLRSLASPIFAVLLLLAPALRAEGTREPAAAPAPAAKETTVEFSYRPEKREAAAIKEVTVAGDFNNWSQFAHPLAKGDDGVFRAKVRVKPGRHEWRLVINGSWVHDMHSVAGRCTPAPEGFSPAQDGGQNAHSTLR